MDIKKGDEASEFRLTDEERQPCEIWTRLWCHGIFPPRFRIQYRQEIGIRGTGLF